MTSDAGGRDLRIPGLHNARDLGGLPIGGGGVTPRGVFIRSERPTDVPEDGWTLLRGAGVRAVLDLRQQDERGAAPGGVPDDVAALHVEHDGLEHVEFWAAYWDSGLVGTPLYYLPHLAALPERTVAVLSAIATSPSGAVLVHCAGGRDRTGLIAAVLLATAGVETDAIVADYLTSIANADALATGLGLPNGEPEVARLLAERGTTSEAAFRAFLAGLDVDALLTRLPPEQERAIRTWRGALPGGE